MWKEELTSIFTAVGWTEERGISSHLQMKVRQQHVSILCHLAFFKGMTVGLPWHALREAASYECVNNETRFFCCPRDAVHVSGVSWPG